MVLSLKTKITTPRFDETCAFYQTVLSLSLVERWSDRGGKGAIYALAEGRGEAFLEISDGEDDGGYANVSLQWKSADLDRFIRNLDETIAYDGPKDRPWGARYLYLTDPNGIQVIIYEGGA